MVDIELFSRRELMHRMMWGAGALLSSGPAFAMGSSSLLSVAVLRGVSGDVNRASGIEKLMWEAEKRTSMKTRETPRTLTINDDRLYEYPLIVLVGTGEMKPLSSDDMSRLRHFLKLGGTLFVDDASHMGDERFDISFRAALSKLWIEQPLKQLPRDHTFYRTFYMLSGSSGRVSRDRYLYGVDFEDRSPVIYSRNDVFGALCRDRAGQWALPIRPGGPLQREMSLRFGINLLMYSTCLNYKRDQVHVPAILKRRKWRVGE